MIAVTIITLADIKLKPITSSCSSSSNAGNENTAMNTSGACRLNRNITTPHRNLGTYLHNVARNKSCPA